MVEEVEVVVVVVVVVVEEEEVPANRDRPFLYPPSYPRYPRSRHPITSNRIIRSSRSSSSATRPRTPTPDQRRGQRARTT